MGGSIKSALHLAYASDENFCPQLSASLASVLASNRGEALCVHLLSLDISGRSLRRLKQQLASAGCELRLYPVAELSAKLKREIPTMDTGRFSVATLARLFLSSLLPADLERVLYLDADTVVLGPLRPLYELKLAGRLAAAAPEPTIYPQVRRLLGLGAMEPYFNAGVLLLNLERWRQEETESACLRYYARMGGCLPFNDQDILNYVLRGRIRALPQRFNFFSNYYYFRYSMLCGKAPWYPALESEAAYRHARRAPVLVHFAGAERPWIAGSFNPYRGCYRRALAASPWADTALLGGQRLAMLAYHGMNLCTLFAPGIRARLSERYYEHYMRRT